MNSQPEPDLERRLQKLEAEIDQTPPSYPVPEQSRQPQTSNNSPAIASNIKQFSKWFNGLSKVGKLMFISVAAVIGFAILRAVLQLVASLIGLAILGVVLYFVYQFFLAQSSETKD